MGHGLGVRLPQRSCTPLDHNRAAIAMAKMSVGRTGLKPVSLELRATRGCEQSMEQDGKIHRGSSSPRVEFNFSKLYYPWCFGEA